MRYSALGNVSSMAHRSDPILAQTGQAADQIMNQLSTVSASQRNREMDRILNNVQYGLPSKVRRVSSHLGRQGFSSRDALKASLRLVLADWALDHFKKLGTKRLRGDVSGLGASAGQTFLNISQGITCGIAQSPEAQRLAARLAGEGSTGAMATDAGFSVARNICPPPGGAPAPPLPPPLPEPSPVSSIPWVPIAIGGTLLVGLVVFMKMRG